jgi:hypothetical protein
MKTKIVLISALILGTIAAASAQTAQNGRNEGFGYATAQDDMSTVNKVSGENGGS